MSAQPIERPPVDIAARCAAMSDNRIAVEILLGYTALPHPVIVPTPERVHVTVADVDDLAVWLHERGGEVHVSPEFEGSRLYVLHTRTDEDRNGSSVEIWVSCSVPSSASVLHEITAAVAA